MSMSYHAFLLRLRKIAKIALGEYGLEKTKLRFITYSGNGLYQVTVPPSSAIASGKYTLRLHQPDYMKPNFIVSEMEWLSALHQEGIKVPMPVRNLDGEWLTVADGGYEAPQKRNCTLIGWTEGRLLNKNIRPKHFRSLGRVMGRMHEQSRRWKRPKGFARPHWDWEGLFGDGFSYGVPAADARNAIPKAHQVAFNEVLNRVREASEQMGKGKNVYGLIHADLGLSDNVAFHAGEVRPFDFDDCGFGYWVFDFGVTLAQYFVDTNDTSQTMREALIGGYEETATLEGISIEYLDLFIAARIAQLMFFYQASGLAHPGHMEDAKREINDHAKYLKDILKKM
ncbi:MAG: phosphotransferase [Candidatus Thorarchaeota archaeon]|nr:phosphotransferase [Candidatus Thorarchaeota archaeon]